jgi:Domain of unknown function (DUF222)
MGDPISVRGERNPLWIRAFGPLSVRFLSVPESSVLGMTAVAEQPGRPGWALSGAEILAELDALHDAQTRLAARRLELLRYLDDVGHARDLGARDTVELLALRHRLDPQAVRRDLKTAHALTRYRVVAAQLPGSLTPADDNHGRPDSSSRPEPASSHSRHRDGDDGDDGDGDDGDDHDGDDHDGDDHDGDDHDGDEAAGRDGIASVVDRRRRAVARDTVLNPGQAAVITETLDKAPRSVPAADLAVAETELVIAAGTLAPKELRRLGVGVLNTLDTDGPEPPDAADPANADDAAEAARTAETLWFTPGTATSPSGTGGRVRGLRFGGFLTGENAELFQTLIDAAAKPRKTPAGELDPRTLGQRRADALAIVLRAAAATGGEIPAHGGIKPHLSITIPYTDLLAATNPSHHTRAAMSPAATADPAATPQTRPDVDSDSASDSTPDTTPAKGDLKSAEAQTAEPQIADLRPPTCRPPTLNAPVLNAPVLNAPVLNTPVLYTNGAVPRSVVVSTFSLLDLASRGLSRREDSWPGHRSRVSVQRSRMDLQRRSDWSCPVSHRRESPRPGLGSTGSRNPAGHPTHPDRTDLAGPLNPTVCAVSPTRPERVASDTSSSACELCCGPAGADEEWANSSSASRCPRAMCAGSPATPASSRSSSAPTPSRWMSAASSASSPRLSAAPSSPVTAVASSPAATLHPATAMRTT